MRRAIQRSRGKQITDTLTIAHELQEAGIEQQQAEAIAKAIGQGQDHDYLATKADLEPLATKAELYRALWLQGVGIVALLTALARLFP